VTVLGWVAAGVAGAWLVWRGGRRWWDRPRWRRPNLRGRAVPTAAGIALVVPVVLATAVHGWDRGWGPFLIVALGFGGLGLVDDLAGEGPASPVAASGFRGHLGALSGGRVTTGILKLLGGAGVALAAAAVWHRGHLGWAGLGDAALIALTANLANLLDRAPGRAAKAGLAGALVLLAVAGPRLAPLAVMAGATAALAPYDVRERLMLGDTGANALGAVLGLGVVEAAGGSVRTGVLAAVAALNALSEIFSFSAVIARVPLLRALDEAGRRR
jgi:UDP-N-acetylmuramyl pentapeptide phosphotransferase/UDP-N-acetylglucosamine-1-phosphate transferase